jgi:hypothetical protein
MSKIEYSWQIPDNPIFTEIAKDLTDFFGLIRKLSQHGFTEDDMKTMVFSAFYYDKVKNDLSKEINIFLISRVNRIIELNPHLGEKIGDSA